MQNSLPRRGSASFLQIHWAYSDVQSRSKCPDPCLYLGCGTNGHHAGVETCRKQADQAVRIWVQTMEKMISKDFKGTRQRCKGWQS